MKKETAMKTEKKENRRSRIQAVPEFCRRCRCRSYPNWWRWRWRRRWRRQRLTTIDNNDVKEDWRWNSASWGEWRRPNWKKNFSRYDVIPVDCVILYSRVWCIGLLQSIRFYLRPLKNRFCHLFFVSCSGRRKRRKGGKEIWLAILSRASYEMRIPKRGCVRRSFRPSVIPSVSRSLGRSVGLSICPPVRPPVRPSIRPSVTHGLHVWEIRFLGWIRTK